MTRNNLPTRLRELRESAAKTLDEAGKDLGVTESALSRYETGKRDPDPDFLRRAADYYHVSMDYLFGRTEEKDTALSKFARPAGPLVEIPVLGHIRAGVPLLAYQQVLRWEPIARSKVMDGDYFYLEVTGDSMIGANIHPGSQILVRQQGYVEPGEVAVVLVNDEEATVKRVQYAEGKVILIPENPRLRSTVHEPADIRILGKVLKSEMPVS